MYHSVEQIEHECSLVKVKRCYCLVSDDEHTLAGDMLPQEISICDRIVQQAWVASKILKLMTNDTGNCLS